MAPEPAAAPRIVVYGPFRAPFNQKVTLALALKHLPFEAVEPTSPDDFRRWNPKTGLLPVMEYEGVWVPDSAAILDWLDERHPESPLLAADPRVARQQRSLERWTGETFYYYWLRWLRVQLPPDAGAGVQVEGPAGELAKLGILNRVRTAVATGSLPEGLRAVGLSPDFARRLDDLVNLLGSRPFFHADRVSRADLTVVAFLRSLDWGVFPRGPELLDERPALRRLMERVTEATGEAGAREEERAG